MLSRGAEPEVVAVQCELHSRHPTGERGASALN